MPPSAWKPLSGPRKVCLSFSSLRRFVEYLCRDAAAGVPTLFTKEFSLADRVGLVSGGNRGLGLEMAYALIEAGARVVYCVDLPTTPGEDFQKTREYASKLKNKLGEGRLEYISADVTDQVRQVVCG